MKRILVGTRRGVPAINWAAVILTALLVGTVVGSAAAGAWFLLAGEFSAVALPFSIAASLGWLVGESIRIRFTTPTDRLSPLE
jgi:hypothetical protein